jgi:Fe-S cluster assembly iron-binding protein IscA
MRPQGTEEQLKSLKLFSVYLQSYGAITASKEYHIEYCSLDWEDEGFYSPQTSITIETYDKIEKVLNDIIETNELIENSVSDCDNRGQLIIEIDCVERILSASSVEWQLSTTEESGDSKTLDEISEEYDEPTYNEVLRLFEQIGENGEGMVEFQGGGDSGSLNDYMDINGSTEQVSPLIENMLYKWLENTGIDWYNNEGGQGNFIFNPNDGEIILEIGVNFEDDVATDMDFEIRF